MRSTYPLLDMPQGLDQGYFFVISYTLAIPLLPMKKFTLVSAPILLGSLLMMTACSRPVIESAKVTRIVNGSSASNKGFFVVHFGATESKKMYLSAMVDWNGNGYEPSEWVAVDVQIEPKENTNLNVPVEFGKSDLKDLHARIVVAETRGRKEDGTVTDAPLPATVTDLVLTTDDYDVGSLIDLSTVTKPTESMKGDTVERPAAPAPQPQGMPDNFKNDTPDITQRKDECAPASAANSFIRLAGDHGRIDAIPRDPTALVDLLKQQMGWTPQNGVLVGDFSPGKDYAAKQLGLPIHSETVTAEGGDWQHVIDRIDDAIAKGGAAEMRVQATVTDANGKMHNVGGHVVTVTNVVREGQSVSLQIHDPLSPTGTDTYGIDPSDGSLIKYPFLGGKESELVHIRVSAGFLQTWVEPEEHSIIDDLEPAGRATIKVIDVQGHKVPLSEVYVAEPGQCPADHYHASRGGSAKALDGTMVPDTAPQHCGYGKVAEVPVEDCTPDGKNCSPVKKK